MVKKQISFACTGYSVQADWHEGSDKQAVLLVFVGFWSSKLKNSDFVAKIVADTNISALVVDFTGQGESSLSIDETMPAQHLTESAKAYDWVKANYPQRAIHVMGTSYGGFIAAYLSRFRPVQKLILRAPAIYRPEDLYTEHQYIDKLLVREYRQNAEALKKHPLFLQEACGQVSTLVMIHGEDKSVSVETTDAYKTAFAAKTYVAKGFVHVFRDPSNPQEGIGPYHQAIADWLLS